MQTALVPPRTKMAALPVLFLAIVGTCIALNTSRPYTNLTILGLFLDIIGAVILSIPDLKIISRQFYGGRLRQALMTLQQEKYGYSSLSPPEWKEGGFRSMVDSTGFWEVVDVMSQIYDDSSLSKGKTWNDISNLTAVENPTASEHTTEKLTPTSLAIVGIDNGGTEVIVADAELVMSRIQKVIEEFNGRFRRVGVLLLVVGFSLQILSAV